MLFCDKPCHLSGIQSLTECTCGNYKMIKQACSVCYLNGISIKTVPLKIVYVNHYVIISVAHSGDVMCLFSLKTGNSSVRIWSLFTVKLCKCGAPSVSLLTHCCAMTMLQ